MTEPDLQHIITRMQANANVFAALFTNPDPDFVSWQPGAGKWSLLEIACHLFDEEREDFRARLKHMLDSRTDAWTPIEPQNWPTMRKYLDQKIESAVQAFLAERQNSLEWLRSLQNPNWHASYFHQEFGELYAGDFLRGWLAHDYFHIRQINRLHRQWLVHQSSEESLRYAGSW